MDLYNRQEPLNLYIPNAVMVIGVGGIGSWVALDLAMVGVQHIYLVDNDTVEIHNLNRAPFREGDVGLPKVLALSSLIEEFRPECYTYPLEKRVETVTRNEIPIIPEIIVDCRDKLIPLPPLVESFNAKHIKCGYDGHSCTIITNVNYGGIWGDSTGYRVVPSYLVPPQLVASLVTNMICTRDPKLFETDDEMIFTFDSRKLLDNIGAKDGSQNS